MGKAAKNEVKKLTATFCNNVGVALFAAGVAIPLIDGFNKTDADTGAFLASLLTYDGLQRGREHSRRFRRVRAIVSGPRIRSQFSLGH